MTFWKTYIFAPVLLSFAVINTAHAADVDWGPCADLERVEKMITKANTLTGRTVVFGGKTRDLGETHLAPVVSLLNETNLSQNNINNDTLDAKCANGRILVEYFEEILHTLSAMEYPTISQAGKKRLKELQERVSRPDSEYYHVTAEQFGRSDIGNILEQSRQDGDVATLGTDNQLKAFKVYDQDLKKEIIIAFNDTCSKTFRNDAYKKSLDLYLNNKSGSSQTFVWGHGKCIYYWLLDDAIKSKKVSPPQKRPADSKKSK